MSNITKAKLPKDEYGNDPNDHRTDSEYLEKIDIVSPYEFSDKPIDIFNKFNTPSFPVDLLPGVISSFTRDQSELIGVDPAIIGIAALVASAAVIDDRIEIQPKRYDPTWREQARLWGAIIGDPSAKKSPGIAKAVGPLFKIDREWREESNEAYAKWEAGCDKSGKNSENPDEPKRKRLIVNDVTVEKLGDISSKCTPRGILSYQDELTGWLSGMDAYKNGGHKDRAAWLETYNGGAKSIDRMSRGSTFVENWSACVVGGIQPSVVQSYTNNTNHDGMMQRFILIEAGEASAGIDRSPDMKAKGAYEQILRRLSKLQPPFNGVVRLSEEAHLIREEIDSKLLKSTRSIPNKFLAAALGKWNGLFARLILVFHSVEMTASNENIISNLVSGETAERVATLMWKVLLPHAIKFYEELDPTESASHDLASLILARKWDRFSVKRDLNRNMKAYRRQKPWERDDMLDRLLSYDWITPEEGKINERGRPSAYAVNPQVHKLFKEQAEHEKLRRKEVREIINELKETD